MNADKMVAGAKVDCAGETVTVIGFRRGLVTTGDRGPVIAWVAKVQWSDGQTLEVPASELR